MDGPAAIATEVLAALDGGRQLPPFTGTVPGFDVAAAYRVTAELRSLRIARGERPTGRKIGFTNRGIWDEYGVHQPIWGDVWDTTLDDVAPRSEFGLGGMPEPRIEPEIVLCIGRDIEPGMDGAALGEAIEWVAHGFEIVQSIFPGWRFKAADCIADGGLHGALLVGPRHRIEQGGHRGLAAALRRVSLALACDGEVLDRGTGANVLDGPLDALGHLAAVLAADPDNPPLRRGEIVTTGTLTRAFPVAPGQCWSTSVDGFPLAGLSVTFR